MATHSRQAFVETNIVGTLAVLEAALESAVSGVVFSSTTSAFGGALRPGEGEPAAWVDEEVEAVPRNIYGVTKKAAEDLCELFFRSRGLDRVYVNRRAQNELDWRPRYDFRYVLDRLRRGDDVFSPLAKAVGSKGYHAQSFGQQPYPVEN